MKKKTHKIYRKNIEIEKFLKLIFCLILSLAYPNSLHGRTIPHLSSGDLTREEDEKFMKALGSVDE